MDYYYNESWQVLEEREDGGENPLDQYVWDIRYIDAPVVRFHDGNTDGDYLDAQDNTLYYTQDANMNATALVSASGAVVERYVYDAYGKATFLDGNWDPTEVEGHEDGTASAYSNERLFTGHPRDAETGLVYARWRYELPPLGVWTGRDMAEYADTSNLYQYCRGSPGQYVDPYGLEAQSPGLSAYEPVAGDSKALANPKAGAPAEKGKFCHVYRKWPDYTLEIKLGNYLGGWVGGSTVAIVRTAARLVDTVATTVGEKILGRVASVAGRLDYPVWQGTLTYRTREGEAHYEAVCKKAEDGTESWVWSDKAYYTYARWVDEKASTKDFSQQLGPGGMPARVPLTRIPGTGELGGTKENLKTAMEILRADLLGQVTAFLQHRNLNYAPSPKVNDKADFRYITEGP